MSHTSSECLVDIEYPSEGPSSDAEEDLRSRDRRSSSQSDYSFLLDDLSVRSSSPAELAQGVEDLQLGASGSSPDLVVVCHDKKDDETEEVRQLIEDVTLLHTGAKRSSQRGGQDTEKTLKRLSETSLIDEEIKRLRREFDAATLNPTIQSTFQGGWRIIYSRNLEPFVKNLLKELDHPMGKLEEQLFTKASPHFEFEGDVVTMYLEYQGNRYYTTTSTLGKPLELYGYTRLSLINDNRLITTDKKTSSGMVMSREERYVKNGQLNIVVDRYGVRCTRIYEKII